MMARSVSERVYVPSAGDKYEAGSLPWLLYDRESVELQSLYALSGTGTGLTFPIAFAIVVDMASERQLIATMVTLQLAILTDFTPSGIALRPSFTTLATSHKNAASRKACLARYPYNAKYHQLQLCAS